MLKADLVDEAGLEMVVKEATHRDIKRGESGRGTLIDHIYTNIKQRLENVSVEALSGSHHSLVVVVIRKKVKFQSPHDMM